MTFENVFCFCFTRPNRSLIIGNCLLCWSFVTHNDAYSKKLITEVIITFGNNAFMWYSAFFNCSFVSRNLWAPSADRRKTLPYNRKCVVFIIQVQKFGRHFSKKSWGQNVPNLGRFRTTLKFAFTEGWQTHSLPTPSAGVEDGETKTVKYVLCTCSRQLWWHRWLLSNVSLSS